MRNAKRIYFDIANLKALTRLNVFDLFDRRFRRSLLGFTRPQLFLKHSDNFSMRGLGKVGRTMPEPGQLRDSIGMIGMLVRDQNCVNAFRQSATERLKAPLDFLAAKTSVDKEGGVCGFEQRRVARAARGEDRYAERDSAASAGK